MKPQTPFKLRRASFKGRGLRTELRGAAWETMRDLCYGVETPTSETE